MLEGRYFDPDKFVDPDPQRGLVSSLQGLNGTTAANGVFTSRCTLSAVAMIVPAGTADSCSCQ